LELNRYEQTLARVKAVFERCVAPSGGSQYAWEYAWAKLYEGVALAHLGRRNEAHASLDGAHRWFKKHDYVHWAAQAKLEEAEAYLGEAKPRQAIHDARVAARLFQSVRVPIDEARAHLVVAEGAFQIGRVSEAAAAVDRAYPVFAKARVPGPLFRCLHLQGRIALHKKDGEKARRLLTRAVATAERTRATVQVQFRRAFLDDKSSAYAELVRLHLNEGRVALAHRLVDQAKSRALVDSLSDLPNRRSRLISSRDLSLLAEIEAVRREYRALSLSALPGLEATALRSPSGTVSARRVALEQRLAALWDDWELRQAARVAPPNKKTADEREMFGRIPDGASMVEYFVADSRVLAFVSDQRGLTGWLDLGPIEPIRQSLELLQLNLDTALVTNATAGAIPPGLTRNANALLHELYRHLWQPLSPLLGDRRRFILVPHGVIHLVPFEALHDGQDYLVARAEMVLAPSKATWIRCEDLASRVLGTRNLVMGYNPEGALPFVDEEVRRIAGALGTEPHLGVGATTGLLLSAGPCRVVHMAVHGEFRLDNPNFSTLLLADGPLTAVDAASLDLDASLVVLSGCESGLSRITRGEELMGMISAFLQAGSASVLASRWRVDDWATAELMQRFYDGLLAGKRKATALRDAQAAMAAKRAYPLYWAAFGLVGHGGLLQ
jgi:tetratricopeptide (TPR) repeat protein